MTTIKYVFEEQHKMVSTKILSNLCINFNVHVIVNYNFSKQSDRTIQDLI